MDILEVRHGIFGILPFGTPVLGLAHALAGKKVDLQITSRNVGCREHLSTSHTKFDAVRTERALNSFVVRLAACSLLCFWAFLVPRRAPIGTDLPILAIDGDGAERRPSLDAQASKA